jgi:DNA-binding MarR family transcriptional regulator
MKTRHDSLGFLLVEVSRLMRRAFKERLLESCLTHSQARTLVYASRNEGIRQCDLAELLEVQPITLVRLIDRLAEVGLVERRLDPKDRRAFQIYLTPAAAPHLAAIEQVAEKIRTVAMRDLSEKQAASVFQALSKIRDNLGSR